MTPRSARLVFALTLLALGALALAAPRAAAPQVDVLPALLTEVRGLRVAMEQMATAGPRIQLVMGRLQLQEERVNTLLRRLDGIRADLRNANEALARSAQQQGELERASGEPHAPEQQRQIEAELAMLKTVLPRLNAEYQRLVAEESSVAQEVAAEQTRWSEINQRLDELERTLTGAR